MKTAKIDFLKVVLGEDGYAALNKAVDRYPLLSGLLLPRTALSWIHNSGNYKGQLPGTKVQIQFKKSEGGYDGLVSVGETTCNFDGADVSYVASIVTTVLGESCKFNNKIRDCDIKNFGKSVDTLVEFKLKKNMGSQDLPGPPARQLEQTPPVQDEEPHKQPPQGDRRRLPPAGGVKVPDTPRGTLSPKVKIPTVPGLRSMKSLRLSESDFAVTCKLCKKDLFQKKEFVGCTCFSDLAQFASVAKSEKKYTLLLDEKWWDEDAIMTLISTIRGGHYE